MADLVIGSGPSGAAAAKALLDRGREVVMIDVGKRLEPEAEARRLELAGRDPSAFPPEAVEAYRRPQWNAPPGQTLRFGSDFAFSGASALNAGNWEWLGLKASFAKGGLSNVWGSAVLPYRQEDIADWPVRAADLAPHYDAVASIMPISGQPDALQSLFPAQDAAQLRPLRMSRQASRLVERLDRHRQGLGRAGVHFGAARQAVSSNCKLCGLCLHGCPYGYIYNAAGTVDEMTGHAAFGYLPGRQALRFAEEDGGVRVTCRREGADQLEEIQGERLFVAAGILPSAMLMLSSLPDLGDEAVLLDSQHFFTPMLHWWPSGEDPAGASNHTLTQVFLEIDDRTVSPFLVHTQIYGHNDFHAREMKRRYGALLPLPAGVYEAVARRLIVAQTFLHSDHSHKLALRKVKAGDRFAFAPRLLENPDTGRIVRAARRRLAGVLRRAGLFAITPASTLGAPGSSFHVGGSFPMSRAPRGLETDLLGRPAGLRRVHLVDASVLPSVPATTITFTVMANAHRIASQSP